MPVCVKTKVHRMGFEAWSAFSLFFGFCMVLCLDTVQVSDR